MKTFILALLSVFVSYAAMAVGTLSLTSSSLVSSDPFGGQQVLKQEYSFTAGPSPSPTIPPLVLNYLGGKVEKVVYIPASPSPSPAPTIKLLDPESGIDELFGQVIPTSGSSAQEFYPNVSPTASFYLARPPLVLSAPTLSITGNTLGGAKGTVIFYLKAE